jgi:hypothetical protein
MSNAQCADCAATNRGTPICEVKSIVNEKCYPTDKVRKCGAKALHRYTINADCSIGAESFEDGEGKPLTKAQYDALESIPCAEWDISHCKTAEQTPVIITGSGIASVTQPTPGKFVVLVEPTVIPPQKDGCTLFKEALSALPSVTPLATDEIQVLRNGACVKVPLALALQDINVQSIVPSAYNPVTGSMSFAVTETDGSTFVVAYVIGPFAETPFAFTDSSTIDGSESGTNGHSFTAKVKLSATAGNILQANADGLFVAKLDCASNSAPAIALCYGDTLTGCDGQKYTVPLAPKHAFVSAKNAAPTILTAAFLDSTKSPAPAPVVTVVPLFDNTNTTLRGGGATGILDRFFSSIYEIFPFSNPPSPVQAGDVLMLTVAYGDASLASGAQTFQDLSTVTTTGGTATTSAWTMKSRQKYWDLSGTGFLDVNHEVWTANVLTSGTVVATVNNQRFDFNNAAVVYVLEALRSTGVISVGAPYLQQMNAFPVVDGGTGPVAITAPSTTGQYYWSVGMRHNKAASGAFAAGPTLSSLVAGSDGNACLATAMTALGVVGGNTATITSTINNPALVPASKQAAQSLIAIPITSAPVGGGGSIGIPTNTGFALSSTVCNPNACDIQAMPIASVNPGLVTAAGVAGDIYRLDYRLDGISYGVVDIRSGQSVMSPALPKKLLPLLAAGACATSALDIVVTVLSSTAGQSGPAITINSPELVIEAAHV